jgi:hypothetical protein
MSGAAGQNQVPAPSSAVNAESDRRAAVAALVAAAVAQVRQRKGGQPSGAAATDAGDSELAPIPGRRLGRRSILVATAVAIALVPLIAMVTSRAPARTLPIAVWGEWRTNSPNYADRFLRLSADRVTLGFGDIASPVEFPVSEVRSTIKGDTTVFLVEYHDGGGVTRLTFGFVSGAKPSLHLSSPAGAPWHRRSSSATPRRG